MIETPKEQKNGKLYGILLTVSLGANIILGIISARSSWRISDLQAQKNQLEIDKGKIEAEQQSVEHALFMAKHKPSLSTFYLISNIENLHAFLKSKERFPYDQHITSYRMLENNDFLQLTADLDKLKKRTPVKATVHFLVIANSSDNDAHNTKLTGINGNSTDVGRVEAHSAVLIPVHYARTAELITKISPTFASLEYDPKPDSQKDHYTAMIKDPVNPSWTPVLGDMRGWGRASVKKDDDYLKDVPKQ